VPYTKESVHLSYVRRFSRAESDGLNYAVCRFASRESQIGSKARDALAWRRLIEMVGP